MEQKFYICKHCGNIIAKVKDTGVPVICCGEPMSEIVPGTTYERAILGKVDTTTPEYRAFREAICKDALGRMGLGHLLKTKEKEVKEVGHER